MSGSVRVLDLYKTPKHEILNNRKKFHHLRRKRDETIADWLERVQNSIDCCKYPKFIIEFLLIDRFLCGLINHEMATIQLANTWSLKRIMEYFVEPNANDAGNVATNSELDENDEQFERSPEVEIEDEESLLIEQGELQNAEEIQEAEEEESDVNQDLRIDDIKCEFEDYEYSTNEAVVYESIDDANISTASYQLNSNDDDETMESMESSDMQSFDCTICDDIHFDQKSLDAHLRTVHNEEIVYKCPHCFTEFPEYDELLEHFNIHNGLKRFKCRLCSKWFLYSNELPKHINKEHSKKYRIKCLDCDKTLQNNQIFITHYRAKHMKNDGFYVCCICNKPFTVAHSFTRHLIMVHQKHELYSCNVCGKSFSSYERQQSHLHTHTGDRPFKCDRCNRSYTAPSILAKHKRDSHSKKLRQMN